MKKLNDDRYILTKELLAASAAPPCMPPSRPTSLPSSAATQTCQVTFGAATASFQNVRGHCELAVPLRVLGGTNVEYVLEGASMTRMDEGCIVFETFERVAGFALASEGTDLELAARQAYERLFAMSRGLKIYRVWNYVPRINETEAGLENYRRFCRGRSHAFEAQFGHAFQRQLPAASAVGTANGVLSVAFLAGHATPHHFENPRQVPAFEYPPEYGPRPPSFSRATSVESAEAQEIYVSGTAAIRGHATIAGQDLAGQLACTRENLHVIAATAGAGVDFGAKDGWQRSLKIYLRRDTDFPQVRHDLERNLLQPDDVVTYLQADLCRADLLVEIEAVLSRPSA